MGGRHSFDRLRAGLPAEGRTTATAITDAMERELSLSELRRARAMTQEQLAADLHVGQASIAKLEQRTDMYLSTLRRFVEAMGGGLEIVARFPDQPQVRLRGIGELNEAGEAASPAPSEPETSGYQPPATASRVPSQGGTMTAADFRAGLGRILAKTERSGDKFADVNSGNLHREVGGYPGPNHRMPVCCAVMRAFMRAGDRVLAEPPKGKGASLTIRYTLPR